MKIVNIILSILFIVFAAVQLNDPDPFLWVGLYLFIALICGLAAFNKYPKWGIIGGLVICLIGMGMLLPDFIDWLSNGAESITQSMKAEKPHIELTREFLGLFICVVALGFQFKQASKATK
jgi:hypothetical protein